MNKETNDLAGVGRGDANSFERIYRRHRDRVYGFAYRMLNSQSMAEDVTHEAFLVLIEHPERYRVERGSMLTFLCSVARNHIMHHFRRNGHEVQVMTDSKNGNAGELMMDSFTADPLANLIEDELVAEIDRAVESLPVLLREAIVLRQFQELSDEEIAEVTGASVKTIRVRLHRARRALAGALETYTNMERRLSS